MATKRKSVIEGNVAYIPLGGKAIGKSVVVDKEYAWLDQYSWHMTNNHPAAKTEKGYVKLHLMVRPPKEGYVVDHINGNTLDARLSNLRYCTQAENMMNSKARKHSKVGLKGVQMVKDSYYRTRVRFEGKTYNIGVYPTAQEAAINYDIAAIQLHGPYARTNYV